MLIQLTVENILSFKTAVTFSMLAINSDSSHRKRLAVDEAGKDRSVLPIAAIYGANAAGKSNLIRAIAFARDLVVEGTRSNQLIPINVFRLANSNQTPSKFEFKFTYKKAFYSYGFTLNSKQILEEWLYGIPQGKKMEVLFFERSTAKNGAVKVEYGASLRGRKNGSRESFLNFIAKGTRPNQLFLTEAVDRNVKNLVDVLKWFDDSLIIIPAEARCIGLEFGIMHDKEFTQFLSDFLKSSGTGIDSIEVDEVTLDLDELPDSITRELRQQFAEADEDSVMMVENVYGNRYFLAKGERDNISLMQIKTNHLHENGKLMKFSIDEESDGTQRLINLIPALFILHYDSEKVILLDELDRRLHPLLSRQFLDFYLQYMSNRNNNQIIFTTHDTNLLNLELLRRDEIWFVEKDKEGSSNLYSLAEFRIRPDLKIGKGYLNGRFGAIPFFGNIERLGWFKSEVDDTLSPSPVA
ncbi:MAG: ATP/GTP-binding protein [Cyanobacteria bacterium P01_F01_bin.150]